MALGVQVAPGFQQKKVVSGRNDKEAIEYVAWADSMKNLNQTVHN